MIKHLKAFFSRQEMLDDWNKCVQTADEAKFNQMTMTKDGVETFYTYYDHTNDGRIEMQIAGRVIKCMWYRRGWEGTIVSLPLNYTEDEYNAFMSSLDFKYRECIFDETHTKQELYGMIWYTDGTWSERKFYSEHPIECWNHHFPPAIHMSCLR